MQCMKCGKDTTGEQIFCDSCLRVMEAYPVKAGSAVNLPRQKTPAEYKKAVARKRIATTDEQIANLQKHLRNTRIVAWIMAVLLLAASGMLVYEMLNPNAPVIGLNYTVDTTTGTD